jgi:phospholipid/cholesterol/gamma-HCH transport system permease protein
LTHHSEADHRLTVSRDGDAVVVRLGGDWNLRGGLPSTIAFAKAIDADPRPSRVRVENVSLGRWDSSLVTVLAQIEQTGAKHGLDLDLTEAPAGAQRLLEIAREGVRPLAWSGRSAIEGARTLGDKVPPLTEAVGRFVIEGARTTGDKIDFLGSTAVALWRILVGRTWRLGLGMTTALQEAGVGTLPVLAILAFSGGAVLSLLANQQLGKLGAPILAPQLVAIVILRELGALATGVALAFRVGSGIAAELATMAAGKEVDALRAMGISPFDFLVAPRVLALVLMGPLLVVYANTLGLLGGLFVGVSTNEMPVEIHLESSKAALTLKHAIAGLVKGAAFGLVVGMAGCYYGLRSGKTPGSVGQAVQTAVVRAVLGVVLADAVLTLVFKWVRL